MERGWANDCGFVDVVVRTSSVDPETPAVATAQAYTLPDEHAFFLASEDTDHFVGGLFAMVPPLMRVAPQVARAVPREGLPSYGVNGGRLTRREISTR